MSSTSTSTITKLESNQTPFENKIESEEHMNLYKLLLNKRYNLASIADCMPYMIASNEALMKMAREKPITLQELRNCQCKFLLKSTIYRLIYIGYIFNIFYISFFLNYIFTVNGFTDTKINTFGDEFLSVIRENCNVNIKSCPTSILTIENALSENPLPGVKISATAVATYSLYKSGLTVQEIATKR